MGTRAAGARFHRFLENSISPRGKASRTRDFDFLDLKFELDVDKGDFAPSFGLVFGRPSPRLA